MVFLPIKRTLLNKKRASGKFITSAADNTNLTTYTFSGTAIGDPHPTRLVVVVAHAEDGATTFTLASGTIGGLAATREITGAPANTVVTGILRLAYPNDKTADIGVTWSEPVTSCAIGVFALYNLNSFSSQLNNEDTGTGNLDADMASDARPYLKENTFVIAGSSNVGGETCTWSNNGIDSNFIVEAYDADSAELGYSGCLINYPNYMRPGSRIVRASWSGAGQGDLVLSRWE